MLIQCSTRTPYSRQTLNIYTFLSAHRLQQVWNVFYKLINTKIFPNSTEKYFTPFVHLMLLFMVIEEAVNTVLKFMPRSNPLAQLISWNIIQEPYIFYTISVFCVLWYESTVRNGSMPLHCFVYFSVKPKARNFKIRTTAMLLFHVS
jgi:hypothetical protein